jgi:hypothetical protein
MKYCWQTICFFCMLILLFNRCKEPYIPPVTQGNNGYLVVDGTIVNGADSTIIKLSRTRNLSDTALSSPEYGAQVMVVGESSEVYPLQDLGNGRYAVDQLSLNNNEKYQLKIISGNGKEYLSDPITVKLTPPIDSVSWVPDTSGLQIYVTTHDPQNNTKYYRWDYTETWQYHTNYETSFDVVNGLVVPRSELIFKCWSSNNSTDIKIGTSIKLSQDLIYLYPIQFVALGSERLSTRYSILVRQYAISADTYNYFQNLRRNTEQVGTLFDAQPSQLPGNIHCTTSPDEPVLGFIDASTLQEQRIFIDDGSVIGLHYTPYYNDQNCMISSFSNPDSLSYYFPDSERRYVFIGTTPQGGFLYSTTTCADCREHGGTNIKPNFWP